MATFHDPRWVSISHEEQRGRSQLDHHKTKNDVIHFINCKPSRELLDLSNNIIEVIEEESLLACTHLRELNLAQNNITFTFALPSTLQIAILKINTLYHWPKFPSGITYIDLSYNRLSTLYDEGNVDFENLEVMSRLNWSTFILFLINPIN